MRRPVPPIALALCALSLCALPLAGCTATVDDAGATTATTGSATSTAGAVATDAASDCAPAASGAASEAVSVEGAVGSAPTVSIDAPVSVEATEATTLVAGSGETVLTGSRASVEYTMLSGSTGEVVAASGYDGTDELTLTEGSSIAGIDAMICGAAAGGRVVAVIPPADAWGSSGQSSLGIGADDSIVLVVDVTAVIPPIVTEDYTQMDGMPTVEFDAEGVPTITIPDADPPASTRLGLITAGDGDVVQSGATVTVDYTGVDWQSGEVFDSSWASGEAATFTTTGVVNGFRAALEGQTVGSTLMVVCAPVDGYGDTGSSDGSIAGGDTIVFVLTIRSVS
ncbi:MAG: FKBP-type peptidyl-prolyl cis-trans isomerase [Microbacteriaceae bacterium]